MSNVDAKAEVDRIFNQIDVDHNGCIDYSEFVTVTMDKRKLLSKKRLKTAFNLFDKDNSGSIDTEEFKNIFKKVKANDDVWKTLIKSVDENSDGEIDFNEFKDMILNLA